MTIQAQKEEGLFENRSEDEDLAPYSDEKRKNKDAEREKLEREKKMGKGKPSDGRG
jgi:hypothetical protein